MWKTSTVPTITLSTTAFILIDTAVGMVGVGWDKVDCALRFLVCRPPSDSADREPPISSVDVGRLTVDVVTVPVMGCTVAVDAEKQRSALGQ